MTVTLIVSSEEQQQTVEAKLRQKRETYREFARLLGPEALADFERRFGKKQG